MHEEHKRTILFPETSVNHLPHVGGSPAQIREGLGAVHSADIWLGPERSCNTSASIPISFKLHDSSLGVEVEKSHEIS